MKCYKLTDSKGETRNNTQWGNNVTHTATGTDPNLCSVGWIHFYTEPRLAVIMNPAHADFKSPILWEAEYSGKVVHEPLKSGAKILTTIQRIPLPEISPTQKIAFGIYCAKEVYKDEQWNNWADKWLSGEDRTKESADIAYAYASAAYADTYAARAASAAAGVNVKINFVELLDKAMLIK